MAYIITEVNCLLTDCTFCHVSTSLDCLLVLYRNHNKSIITDVFQFGKYIFKKDEWPRL